MCDVTPRCDLRGNFWVQSNYSELPMRLAACTSHVVTAVTHITETVQDHESFRTHGHAWQGVVVKTLTRRVSRDYCVRHTDGKQDHRYTVALEGTGDLARTFVARFCGESIGAYPSERAAWIGAQKARDAREYAERVTQ